MLFTQAKPGLPTNFRFVEIGGLSQCFAALGEQYCVWPNRVDFCPVVRYSLATEEPIQVPEPA